MRLWLESTKKLGMALGLLNTSKAVEALHLQPSTFTTVHVAGSNGKGTTCALLCTALTNEGISNLLFSSPHLIRVEERIRINGAPIHSNVLDRALEKVQQVTRTHGIRVTFFEVTFLAALVVASELEVEVMVLETGLGGRLDATRVAEADISVLTTISTEHTDVLGKERTAIAREKAAIARANRPLIVRSPGDEKVCEAIEETALNAGMNLLNEECGPADVKYVEVPSGATFREEAQCLVEEIWSHLQCVNHQKGPITSNCVWPARMQIIEPQNSNEPGFLLDGAHNPSGISRAVSELSRQSQLMSGNWVLLFGTSPQTDMKGIMEPLIHLCRENPPAAIILSEPQGGRYPPVPTIELKSWFDTLEVPIFIHPVPSDAVAHAKHHYDQSTLVVSIGSLYMQGNVLVSLGIDSDADLSFVAKH
ncbi:MAG TPA: Mur ligase family protein [Poseidonia sp.]|nr:Mur ligase family protein [Poseidonia sp.]